MTRLIDLPAVLRHAGLVVRELAGWDTRANNPGSFTPTGQMAHHDAMALGWNSDAADDLNVPANMIRAGQGGANLWWPRRPEVVGFDVAVLAAGGMPHAGDGPGWGLIPAGQGNRWCASHEVDITAGIDWPAELLTRFHLGTAALHQHYKWQKSFTCTHHEYAPARKFDPDPAKFDPAAWRATLDRPLVELRAAWHKAAGRTPPTPPTEEDMPLNDADKAAIRSIVASEVAKVWSIMFPIPETGGAKKATARDFLLTIYRKVVGK